MSTGSVRSPADQLRADLRALDGRLLADPDISRQLYRALTNRCWSRRGQDGELALSWGEAEAMVNLAREERGHRPLPLAGSGGEGWLSDAAAEALLAPGWTSRPVLAAQSANARPFGGDSTAPRRRFGRPSLRTASAETVRSWHTHGGVPPQPSA